MLRRICKGMLVVGCALLPCSAAAQLRPNDAGLVPSPRMLPGMSAPQLDVPPVAVPPTQTPVITNQDVPSQREPAAGKPAPQRAPVDKPSIPARAPSERNGFQELVSASTGQRLPLFGRELFEGAPSTFAPVENIAVPSDYVVGPGDELAIRAWGQIEVDYRAMVDRNGMVSIPRVGSVNVAGVRYADLTRHVRAALAREFRNFDLVVALGQLRSVQVFVVGYARRPGSYTVSSLSTLVNAAFAAGGPSPAGSMRAIQLKRGGQTVTELDLYDLLLNGDKSKDAPVLPGDVIYFPPIGPLAAVAGEVNHRAIFELKGATTLGTLLAYAGGLATTAQSRQVTIERIVDRNARVVEQLDLDAASAQRAVRDGDLVSVLAILPRFENTVTLRGNVAIPLRHPWRPGMRVRDLVPDKEALVTPEYYRRQNLATRDDAVSQGQLIAEFRRLADEINWDYAVIERMNGADLSTALIPFNLAKAVNDGDPAHNLPLQPGDVVTVFSKADVGAPVERRPVVVRLEGEFENAGVYQARQGESLRRLVVRAGGLTPMAYLFGAEFTRESTRRDQEERLKQAVDQLEQEMSRAASVRAQSAGSLGDAEALRQELEAQRALIARLRLARPTGRIVLELPADAAAADLPDIPLEDGDRLRVPQRPSMVSVFGSVFGESSFLYRPEKTISDYLAQAGGLRREADRDSIFVLRADGSVVSRGQSGFLLSSLERMTPMPGDAIVVPEDFQRTTWTKDLRDWTQIFYQFGLGAAALKVIGD